MPIPDEIKGNDVAIGKHLFNIFIETAKGRITDLHQLKEFFIECKQRLEDELYPLNGK